MTKKPNQRSKTMSGYSIRVEYQQALEVLAGYAGCTKSEYLAEVVRRHLMDMTPEKAKTFIKKETNAHIEALIKAGEASS